MKSKKKFKDLVLLTLDAETSIKNRGERAIGKDKASPHHPDNNIVYLGYKLRTDQVTTIVHYTDNWIDGECVDLLIGQNLKFDLLYLMRDSRTRKDLHKMQIWDTQIAEYIISGQQEKMAALGDKKADEKYAKKHDVPVGHVLKQGLATKYGGTDKDDRLKEFWNNDVDTEDIPEDIIKPYLEDDVLNTELVALQQIKTAHEMGILPLIKSQMDALLATTEMEFNGLHFEKQSAREELMVLAGQLEGLKVRISKYFEQLKPEIEVNISSNDQLSLVLFGGKLPYTVMEPMLDEDGNEVLYKSGDKKGQVRYKKQQKLKDIVGILPPTVLMPTKEWKTKKAGIYKTDEEVLSFLIEIDTPAADLAELVLTYREIEKDLTTYYKPYIDLVFPDGCIHGKLNHALTNTGRLSSSAPNLQNITNKDEDD